jgi:hypothetical protein
VLQIIREFIRNIGIFFYSCYTVFFNNFYFYIKIFIFIFFIGLFLYLIKKYFAARNKKFLTITFYLITISFLLNCFILAAGHYHYWGKGIFSRTMFQPSLLIFMFLSIILISNSNKKDLYISFFIFLISFSFFLVESHNWKKSWSLQKKIINSSELSNGKYFLDHGNNLVFFLGPCYYNGVDIFVSTWDLNEAVKNKYFSFKKNNFVPLSNFETYYLSLEKKIIVHKNEYFISNYENLYIWDFYTHNIFRLKKNEDIKNFSLNSRKSCFIGEDLYLKAKTIEKKLSLLLQLIKYYKLDKF